MTFYNETSQIKVTYCGRMFSPFTFVCFMFKDEENANDHMPFVPIEHHDSQLISCNLILIIQFLSKETTLINISLRLWAPTRER